MEQEVQRSFVPVKPISYIIFTPRKPKEALQVISEAPPPEPIKVNKQIDDRRRNVFYDEQRNPNFVNEANRVNFMQGTESRGFDAGDCRPLSPS